jgi:uncharacterized protein YjbI with pentapeptide repeats
LEAHAVALTGLAATLALSLSPGPAVAASNVRLPPLDTDPNRCERAFTGNTIGQANAVSDKILDLRLCNLSGKNLREKTLSGALLADTDLSNANMQEVVMSKAYAVGANFSGSVPFVSSNKKAHLSPLLMYNDACTISLFG